ncbi:uncharacterized protein LOC108905511 [Anoplophora glabripennis]|uniref:uncharacterized protein LOC108905511 n=1 Tax=Anoplophora glabripennis TaxID=217634 RepID=UPI0008740E98|nr:uncharacterized protein LOC108905511 [Anoplophora glabripennis]XP_018563909.1 uncharacterized protein LOC108905511 [Anoplophora glabripennis]XP_023310630.1 uncharacterized protein LOC108905511 [Anoplophora glabripennis]
MEDELLELKVCNENNGTDTNKTTNPQLLLNVVLNNRNDEIDSTVKKYSKDILNHKFTDQDNKNIILIACINERVTKDTLNILCQSVKSHFYYSIDCFDEAWYKWEPLHYVARIADPEKLTVLLDNAVTVNCLTTFSENALHVLLEYQQCVKPFTTLLYNGTESRECIIVNSEKENIFQCAKILINRGIDVNHSNFWNETPICTAVRYRYIRITELLLTVPNIDLDNYKEGRLTIRAYLKENHIRQDTLSQSNVLYEDPVKILFDYLKSGDEEAFVQFNNENIKDYANSIDGDSEFNTSGNMLQYCFKKGYLEYLQHDSYDEPLTTSSITDNLMLDVFYSKGLGKCIEHLLNNGADPTISYRKFSQPLLEAAAVVGYYPFVAILLQHKACKITSDDIFKILPKLYKGNCELKNHEFYRKCVLSLLLTKLLDLKGNEILSSKKLGILNSILHKLNLECDDEKEDDSENICRILKLGASLAKKVEKKKMIIEKIHPDILKLHFDDCVENNLLYYNSIIEDDKDSYSETRTLHFLANSYKKSELLRHPLLIHFIHNKWLRNFYFFYIDLFLYFIFLLSTYAYMVLSHRNHYNQFLNLVFYILLTVHLLKECIQLFFLYRFKYFIDASNYLELTVIISSIISIHNYNEYSAVIAILFSTIIFVMLLGQVPICAKYTIIFGSTKYFLQYAGFYFIQFVAFALVFYIIFPFNTTVKQTPDNNLTNTNFTKEDLGDTLADVFKNLFYTLILFTGEFGDRVLEPDMFPVFGRVIMTVFIFCMTIILNNLLVGLIVADMDEMQRAGKLYKQVKVANFIARMNAIVKRLYEFKTNNFIKYIINFLHIFKKGKNKILDLTKCKHTSVFDDENLKYLKAIRSKKNTSYNVDLLKDVYSLIQDKGMEFRKKIKNSKK